MKFKIALFYLIAVLFFSWGFLVARYQFFPWELIGKKIIKIEKFVESDPFDDTPMTERIISEFVERTSQFEAEFCAEFPEGAALSPDFFDPDQTGLPLFYTKKTEGYYLIYGVFDPAKGKLGPYAILIDVNGNVKRSLSVPFLDDSKGVRRLLITKNGNLLTNCSEALRCYSWQGVLKWELPINNFHHEMEEYDGKIYLWRGDAVVSVDLEDQSITTLLTMGELVVSNPDVVSLRIPLNEKFQYMEKHKRTIAFDGKDPDLANKKVAFRYEDPYHQNHAAVNGDACSLFPKDALLISMRHIDTVFVVDQNTAKVLWEAHFDRQHCPRWEADGITVYNNRPHFQYSTIEYLSFDKKRKKILVDGKDYAFDRYATGNHAILDDGSILFVCNEPEFYHLSKDGEVISRFVNRHNSKLLHVANVFYIDEATYQRLESGGPLVE
ncbi:aryl-sulfate sulfotransferase [Desulfatibacillum aliphaticivorans]|uniref:aryl-sulfate sulfotransferase n=1 Tax=Desulfatibacillum aliphaticivorans TaxID=218208 RepID=UPI00041F288D|nr:aryl-sulfate sulfotransferase [Desulfatibacillum aliphaticivorans]